MGSAIMETTTLRWVVVVGDAMQRTIEISCVVAARRYVCHQMISPVKSYPHVSERLFGVRCELASLYEVRPNNNIFVFAVRTPLPGNLVPGSLKGRRHHRRLPQTHICTPRQRSLIILSRHDLPELLIAMYSGVLNFAKLYARSRSAQKGRKNYCRRVNTCGAYRGMLRALMEIFSLKYLSMRTGVLVGWG